MTDYYLSNALSASRSASEMELVSPDSSVIHDPKQHWDGLPDYGVSAEHMPTVFYCDAPIGKSGKVGYFKGRGIGSRSIKIYRATAIVKR